MTILWEMQKLKKAEGRFLDIFGLTYNMRRKRYFLFFKESDTEFKNRILGRILSK